MPPYGDPRPDLARRILDDRYKVEKLLGVGQMAAVWLATDLRLSRAVVVKVPDERLLAEPGFRERFARELHSLTSFEHPNIVRVLDAGTVDSIPYAVLQYLPGGSLTDKLSPRLSIQQVAVWLRPIAEALDVVHARRVVHRDVKPDNILFDSIGNAVLTDFGIAKVLSASDPRLTESGMRPGTPLYMAPEALDGKATAASDQYALAVVVYEALAGQSPHGRSPTLGDIVRSQQDDTPRRLDSLVSDLPLQVADAVMKALKRNPEQRHASCLAFWGAFRGGLPVTPEATAARLDTLVAAEKERALAEDDYRDSYQVEQEIRRFLDRKGISRWVLGQFVDVVVSPECRGWTRDEVSHEIVGDYVAPPEMVTLMEKFEPKPPIRGTFGLRRCPPLGFADSKEPAHFELCNGTWHHVWALSETYKKRRVLSECSRFRERFGDWIDYPESAPLSNSRLYHNVNAEVIVITSDNQLVLGKRHEKMLAAGAWSASLEEQMLRFDPDKPLRFDPHIFDAAERGVREELAVEPIPAATRLLRVGVEWGNFTAAFLFVVRCAESFDGVVKAWITAPHDPYEAIALDKLEASVEDIQRAIQSRVYEPSAAWKQRVAVERPSYGWHPTSRARLKTVVDHLKFLVA